MTDTLSTSYESLSKQALIADLIATKQALEDKNEQILRLQNILHNLQKSKYGRKSESIEFISKQIALLQFGEVTPPELPAEKVNVPAHERTVRKAKDYSTLPVTRVLHDVDSKQCECCGSDLNQIGEDVSKELEYHPAKASIIEHVRPRYACSGCKDKVAQAELPLTVKPLERCIAGAGLLAHIHVSKYVDHLPLHRQEEIFKRKGLEIPRKSMCEWIGLVVDNYLRRLWEVHKAETLTERYLQADETTIKIQDGTDEGRCHTGYLWGALSPIKKTVFFEYSPSRAGGAAQDIFGDFAGHLQTDFYAGYNPLLALNTIQRIACLAHVRRKFVEIQEIYKKETSVILTLIAKLYQYEAQWKSLDPPTRKLKRQRQSKDIFGKLEQYLRELQTKTLPRAPLMGAINYALSQWTEIVRVLDDGIFELDNNGIERQIRPIALGRKDYLFAGSAEGAERAAIIYSLFGTAKLHKVNPYDWLKDVLTRMRSHPVNRIRELLPQHWTPLAK